MIALRTRIGLACLLALIAASDRPLRAAGCLQISVCSAYATLPLIFRGQVDAVVPLEQSAVTGPDSSPRTTSGSTAAWPPTFSSMPLERFETVSFTVHETFKGHPGAVLTLTAPHGLFRLGLEYLVYAGPDARTHEMAANSCARTHELSRQALEARTPADAADRYYAIWHGSEDQDLQQLRALLSAHGTGTLAGAFYAASAQLATAPLSVTLAGPTAQTVQADPQSRGQSYLFKGLAPGSYTVIPNPPSGSAALPAPTRESSTVTIAANSCQEINFFLRYDAHIRGRVTDTSGLPVAGADVALIDRIYADQIARGRFAASARQKTSADGRYDFAGLNPGDYIVVLHQYTPRLADPYPPVFYPAQPRPALATTLHLATSTSLDEIDFVRPAALLPAIVHVLVSRQDGTPVDRASVIVSDPASSIQVAASVRTDASGRADLPLFAGREYSIIAATPEGASAALSIPNSLPSPDGPPASLDQTACAGPVAFVAAQNLTLPALITDKSWQDCRSATPKLAATP